VKYQQPFGTDEGTSYVNGNPAAGIPGSIPPAEAFEEPMRELDSFIRYSGITPSDNDLEQVTRSVRSQWLNYVPAQNVGAGTQNAIVVTMVPTPLALNNGLPLRIKIAQANTGPVTITLTGFGTFPAKRCNGADLDVNDLLASMLADFVFDGTTFQLVNFRGISSPSTTVNNFVTNIPYIADTSATPNIITATYVPALTAHNTGSPILVKLANTVSGQTTININALPGRIIKKFDGSDFDLGDCVAGEILLLTYDGAFYQLMNDTPPRQRLFLPFFPEVSFPTTAILSVIPSTGNVTIDVTQKFVWRAAVEYRTSDFLLTDRQLATAANKTYHLRWHAPGTGDALPVGTYPRGRFVLKDLTSGTYNPGGASEDSTTFDSKYDDMLIARVITNSSNVPTITSLENRMRLEKFVQRLDDRPLGNLAWSATVGDPVTLNWARIPRNINFRYLNAEREKDESLHRQGPECILSFGMIKDLSTANEGKMAGTRYSTWATAIYVPNLTNPYWGTMGASYIAPYDALIEA
jgi:hypothetical protein